MDAHVLSASGAGLAANEERVWVALGDAGKPEDVKF